FSTLAWWRPRVRSDTALMVVCAGGMALIGAVAIINGWGLNGPVIGFIAVMSFLIGATVSARMGIVLSVAGALLLVGLAWAEHAGWIRGVAALGDMSLPRRL